MSVWDYLAAWPNVPFTIAVGATLLFALVQASGLAGLLGGHGDADGDADADADVDGDVDANADADGDTDGDGDADDADGESWALKLGASVGMGRLPLTLLAQVFLVVFGVSGLLMNVAFVSAGAVPFWTLFYSLPGSMLIGLIANATMTRLLAPIVDDKLQAATKRSALVGSIATVISRQVTEEFGEVRIRDRSGHDLRLVVKLAKDDAGARKIASSTPPVETLREGQEAVVVDVDDRGTPLVTPLELFKTRVADETPYEEKKTAGSARKRMKAARAS